MEVNGGDGSGGKTSGDLETRQHPVKDPPSHPHLATATVHDGIGQLGTRDTVNVPTVAAQI